MKPYVLDGTVKAFELWNPGNLGYLAGYAAAALASGMPLKAGETFKAGKLGTYKILPPAGGTGLSVVLGPPTVFTKANVKKFNF
jgi:rhamnose transport system substrate-binding protein